MQRVCNCEKPVGLCPNVIRFALFVVWDKKIAIMMRQVLDPAR